MTQILLPWPCETSWLRCLPQGKGTSAYGHVWTSNEPGARCKCGAQEWGRVEASGRVTPPAWNDEELKESL